jgi:ABC-2 type transport system permease protein
VVGEKTNRSLEPLLATPITTVELLIGKNLAAVIPAVGATMAGFALFVAGASILIQNAAGIIAAVVSPLWLLAILVAGPLMAVLAVNIAMMVSSRVNDPRVAEQLSAVVILPVLLLFFAQIAGFLFLNSRLVIYLILALIVIDAGVVYLGIHLFERENILTRWK